MDKFRERLGTFLLYAFVAFFIIVSIVIGVSSCLDIVIKILTIAGCGSWKRGIIIAPFFILGAVQILRGYYSVLSKDVKWFDRHYSKKQFGYALFVIYFIATIVGYAAIYVALATN